MIHHRSSDFGSSVTAIQQHLGAVEKELGKIGRIAGRRTSAAAASATDQIGDILSDMMDRFRQGRQVAGDQAGRLGNQALDLGAKYGNGTLRRITGEVEDRPLVTIGVALCIGILIGAAFLGSVNGRRQ